MDLSDLDTDPGNRVSDTLLSTRVGVLSHSPLLASSTLNRIAGLSTIKVVQTLVPPSNLSLILLSSRRIEADLMGRILPVLEVILDLPPLPFVISPKWETHNAGPRSRPAPLPTADGRAENHGPETLRDKDLSAALEFAGVQAQVRSQDLERKLARLHQENAASEATDSEDDLERSGKGNESLQAQCDLSSRKQSSEKTLKGQGAIWILARVPDFNCRSPPQRQTQFESLSTENGIILTCYPAPGSCHGSASLRVDHYSGPSATNEDFYSEIEPLIDIVFTGYGVCICADGQSDIGEGTLFQGLHAIASYVATSVMVWKNARIAGGWKREVKCSAVEIYDDRLKDLLAPANDSGGEEVEILKAKRGHYDKSASSLKALLELFGRACAKLSDGERQEQRVAGQGHVFFSLLLTQSHSNEPSVESRLTLIDLAGGERLSNIYYSDRSPWVDSSRETLRIFLKEQQGYKQGAADSEVRKQHLHR